MNRKLLLALHLVALAACGWVIREIVLDASPTPIAAAQLTDEPCLLLGAGAWVIDGANLVPDDARAKFAPLAPISAPRMAVRVGARGVSAELYGPVNVPEVLKSWRAAGWSVEEVRTDDRPRFVLRRDGREVVAWVLRSQTGDVTHLLIVPTLTERSEP